MTKTIFKYKTYSCIPCGYGPTRIKCHYERHLRSERHKRDGLIITFTYECEPCGYGPVDNLNHFKRHEGTTTHKENLNLDMIFKYNCDSCGVHTDRKDIWNDHCRLIGHYIKNELYCQPCNFFALDKEIFSLHCLTEDHIIKLKTYVKPKRELKKDDKSKKYKCPIEKCKFSTNEKSKLSNHLKTKQHSMSEEEYKKYKSQNSALCIAKGDINELNILNIYKEYDNLFRSLTRIGQRGNKFDIIFEFKNELYTRGIQVKSISYDNIRKSYYFGVPDIYEPETLIVGINDKDNIYCLLYVYELQGSTRVNFYPESKKYTTHAKYFYTNKEKFKNDLIIKSKQSFIIDDIRKYFSKELLLEYESIERFKLKCQELGLEWKENNTNSNEIDFFVNNKKIQHKSSTSSSDNNTYHFNLTKSNGYKKVKPYSNMDQIDYFVFEIANKDYIGNFFIVPINDMIKNEYLKTDKCKGKTSLYIPGKDKWNIKGYHHIPPFVNKFELLK